MIGNRKWLLAAFFIVLMIATLAMPLSALAAPGTVREKGMIHVPAGITEPVTLQVMDISVTIPPGAMPKGGPVVLMVTKSANGFTQADFLPERQFEQPVMIRFGTAPLVYYWSRGRTVSIETDGGEFISDHFSRYSGFY